MRSHHTPDSVSERLQAIASLPGCTLGIRENSAGLITEIVFLPPHTQTVLPETQAASAFMEQIERYRSNPAHPLSLALAARGTPFQQKVWQCIRNIPASETRSYGEIALQLGSAPRAVGQACGANPFPLITPCHRVMGKTGLGGFAHAQTGWLLETKRWLLEHEGAL